MTRVHLSQLWQDAAILLVVLFGVGALFAAKGRLDPVLVGTLVVGCGIGGALNRRSRRREVDAHAKFARSLGYIEVDANGIRWSPELRQGLSLAWGSVTRVVTDPTSHLIVLFDRDGQAYSLGVTSPHGTPSPHYDIDDRISLINVISSHVTVVPHGGSTNLATGRTVIRHGLFACLVAVLLFAGSHHLANTLGWRHGMCWPFPLFLGGVGALFLFAGMRIAAGKGPLVSPLYTANGAGRLMVPVILVSLFGSLMLQILLNTSSIP